MQRHHSEICETGMMPYPTAYLLANVCLVADIRILEEPLVIIQAASGIHSGLLQAFGNLIQFLPLSLFFISMLMKKRLNANEMIAGMKPLPLME